MTRTQLYKDTSLPWLDALEREPPSIELRARMAGIIRALYSEVYRAMPVFPTHFCPGESCEWCRIKAIKEFAESGGQVPLPLAEKPNQEDK